MLRKILSGGIRISKIPTYQRSKWGKLIFQEIVKNGKTSRAALANITDPISGKKISQKMLWETIKKMVKEETLQEVPSIGREAVYDLSDKFKEKKLDQLIYLDTRKNETPMSDTIEFQHSIYGLPEFDDLSDNEKRVVLRSINEIEQALVRLKNIKGVVEKDLALVSTSPIRRTKAVRNNIDLALDELFKEGLLFKKKDAPRLSIGKLCRMEQVILTCRFSCNTKWINDAYSQFKFLHHTALNEQFSSAEINFMLSIIKEILRNRKDIDSADVVKFIIMQGFNEGGLWYDEKEKYFYTIAESIVKSIDPEVFVNFREADRIDKIKSLLSEYKDIPPTITMNEEGEYGLDELILYIEAQIYFKIPRKEDQQIFNGIW